MTRTWRWLEGGPLLATRRRTEDEIEGEGGELMKTVEEVRVGCLELRVWLQAAKEHGAVAAKKLGEDEYLWDRSL